MIAILDYGVGNLFSLRSSLQQLWLQAVVTADADAIRKPLLSCIRVDLYRCWLLIWIICSDLIDESTISW